MKFKKEEFCRLIEKAVDNEAFELVEYLLRKTPVQVNVYVGREIVSCDGQMDIVIATIPDEYEAPRKEWHGGLIDPYHIQLGRAYNEWLETED
ncbi:hypothetical protein [Faecalibaculum rodentium]|uniref:hypothetical protein n=1 Tax=Faecalibaculum rodentium TaxID=1702221 RepID=UPI00266F90B6|nr:hypothetical protein [Faecalibaculum rodentium]